MILAARLSQAARDGELPTLVLALHPATITSLPYSREVRDAVTQAYGQSRRALAIRHALADRDWPNVFRWYDPTALPVGDPLTPTEHSICETMLKEQDSLRVLLAALDGDDDSAISTASAGITPALLALLDEHQRDRVAIAQNRSTCVGRLQAALRGDLRQELVRAFEAAVASGARLPPSLDFAAISRARQQLDLAMRFRAVLTSHASDADQQISALGAELLMQAPDLLNPSDRGEIAAARHRIGQALRLVRKPQPRPLAHVTRPAHSHRSDRSRLS